jgi:hypothetical protein
MDVEFSIYLASKARWAHLVKVISMPVVPRVGEFIKFRNAEMGDYFPWEIIDVTYRETGMIEVMTDLLDNVDGRGYSFEEESEFDEYYNSYLSEGWICERGPKENTRYQSHTDAENSG